MCTHQRFITNKYTRTKFLCKCGKCKACLQEKAAARSSRIRSEYSVDNEVIFVTLTYDRMSCPFVFGCDLFHEHDLSVPELVSVYRHYTLKWDVNKQKYIKDWKLTCLDNVFIDDWYGTKGMKSLAKRKGEFGVCFYKDYQDFMKRFRQNLIRKYNYNEKIKTFNCFEYGEKSQRPHFHTLMFVPKGSYEVIRAAVIESWPFGHRIREKESCQLVYDDPAGYVASYVNSGSSFPSFLAKNFKPKHSISKLFGHGRDSFTISEISKKIAQRDLSFDMLRKRQDGIEVVNLPIPKYVINRYFPLFKGSSRLDGDKVFDYLQSGFKCEYLLDACKDYDLKNPATKIDLSVDDSWNIHVRLKHSRDYVCDSLGINSVDYAYMWQDVWKIYKSCSYKRLMTDDTCNTILKYDNLFELDDFQLNKLITDCRYNGNYLSLDPNENPVTINKTLNMEMMYDKYVKQKEISNFALTAQGVLV